MYGNVRACVEHDYFSSIYLAIHNMRAPALSNLTFAQNFDPFTEASSAPARYTLLITQRKPHSCASSFSICPERGTLDHEPLDLVLESADLAHKVGGLVGGDAARDDSAGDTAGAAKSHLAGDVNLQSLC